MSEQARWEYYLEMRLRYIKADKEAKQKILDEFCKICKYHRKYAIKKLNQPPDFDKYKRRQGCGRKSKYKTEGIMEFLRTVWVSSNLICSKRLVAVLPVWIGFYKAKQHILTQSDIEKLSSISPATIDRLLKKFRMRYGKRGLSTTKPGSMIKELVPIKTNQWNETRPGFIEADTVAHCGTNIAGDYVFSLDTVDIATGWTAQRALWGKGERAMMTAMEDLEKSLPFKILGFDTDNGSEFLNYRLLKYFKERPSKVEFTRSRPYQKNDNAHVEQKNWSIVREYIGYNRLDNFIMTEMLNDVYKKELNYMTNYFIPSMKLIAKQRIGSKIKKIHSKPETPYSRLMQSEFIEDEVKSKLRKQFEKINPFTLHKKLKRKIDTIMKMTVK